MDEFKIFLIGFAFGAILASVVWWGVTVNNECEAKGGIRFQGKCIAVQVIK